jgi:hypothetical protein
VSPISRTHTGPNPSFFRFIKHMSRDSSKMSYTEHMLSSSSSLKNKEVLTNHGGGEIERSGSSFLESIMAAIVVTLEHGTCLCLILQLGNILVSESYQFHVSLYFFVPVEECSYYHHIMFLVLIESMLPSHLSCLTMFKGSFIQTNHLQYYQFPFLCQSILI